ncbi:MAG: hypothetical protein IH946_06930 [Bacteroidetes bacterium]|nr:hypothetical protein [Bacteroidota bacterium]
MSTTGPTTRNASRATIGNCGRPATTKASASEQIDRMIAKGLKVVSCGANVPFEDDGVFFGPTADETDSKISLIPDFIANCGMARVFAYLMQLDSEISDEAIFSDVSDVIKMALEEAHEESDTPENITKTALELAVKKLTS